MSRILLLKSLTEDVGLASEARGTKKAEQISTFAVELTREDLRREGL